MHMLMSDFLIHFIGVFMLHFLVLQSFIQRHQITTSIRTRVEIYNMAQNQMISNSIQFDTIQYDITRNSSGDEISKHELFYDNIFNHFYAVSP